MVVTVDVTVETVLVARVVVVTGTVVVVVAVAVAFGVSVAVDVVVAVCPATVVVLLAVVVLVAVCVVPDWVTPTVSVLVFVIVVVWRQTPWKVPSRLFLQPGPWPGLAENANPTGNRTNTAAVAARIQRLTPRKITIFGASVHFERELARLRAIARCRATRPALAASACSVDQGGGRAPARALLPGVDMDYKSQQSSSYPLAIASGCHRQRVAYVPRSAVLVTTSSRAQQF